LTIKSHTHSNISHYLWKYFFAIRTYIQPSFKN